MTISDWRSPRQLEEEIISVYGQLGCEVEEVIRGTDDLLQIASLALKEMEIQHLFHNPGTRSERKQQKRELIQARGKVADLELTLTHAVAARAVIESTVLPQGATSLLETL